MSSREQRQRQFELALTAQTIWDSVTTRKWRNPTCQTILHGLCQLGASRQAPGGLVT